MEHLQAKLGEQYVTIVAFAATQNDDTESPRVIAIYYDNTTHRFGWWYVDSFTYLPDG